MKYSRPFQPYRAPKGQRRIKTFDPSGVIMNSGKMVEQTREDFQAKHCFADFELDDKIMDNIWAKGYVMPTAIQDQVMPLMIAGNDVVGVADTGTGKTAAFVIPLINKVIRDETQRVLVVAPTRELAVQIEQEVKDFSYGLRLKTVVCIGGVGFDGQIRGLAGKPNFVVGTPGRIKDLANRGVLSLGGCNNVVLDEVDRMLDMGFVHDVTNIMTRVAAQRQTAFFSATISTGVERIIKSFSRNATTVKVTSREKGAQIVQEMVRLNGKPKIEVLQTLLQQKGFDKVLVFGRSKHGLERLVNDLTRRGFNVAAIHGNKSQGARQKSLEMFKSNRVRVLLATDVLSRGLDIDDITHVINYDLPESYEDYVHRIGRTGRADKKGVAVTLM